MSRKELLRLKLNNLQEVDSIQEQLRQAKVNLVMKGAYVNPVWYAKGEATLKQKGRLDQAIQLELSSRRAHKRALKPDPVRTLTEVFMDICQEELPREVFEELKDKAKARLNPPDPCLDLMAWRTDDHPG